MNKTGLLLALLCPLPLLADTMTIATGGEQGSITRSPKSSAGWPTRAMPDCSASCRRPRAPSKICAS